MAELYNVTEALRDVSSIILAGKMFTIATPANAPQSIREPAVAFAIVIVSPGIVPAARGFGAGGPGRK